jgi:hypothetical protein
VRCNPRRVQHRTGKGDAFEKSKLLLRILPTALIRPLLKLTGFLASSMGWSTPRSGSRPIGSAPR